MKDILAIVRFPKATYMYWQKRFDRKDPNKDLKDKILELAKEHKNFGYRRMYGLLRKQGFVINKKRVQKIMQKNDLQVISFTRKSRKYSSYKRKVGKIAPNRNRRRFKTSVVHQKITMNTTEFKYYELDSKGHINIRKLYLDPFMDMYNREILSYSISKSPPPASIMTALKTSIMLTDDCPYRRTFHSDRG